MTAKTKKKHDAYLKELTAIAKENQGVLRAEAVVAFAANSKTALHKRFCWDDAKAGHEYRIWQARQLIAVSVRVLPNVETPYRAFVSLGADRKNPGGGYRVTCSVLNSSEMREELLAEALEELERFKEKYRLLKQLVPVFEAIKKVKRGRKVA